MSSLLPTRASDTPLHLWHLASLDAPTVALGWSLAFAWTAHVILPIWIITLLVLVVWTVYIADRILDAHAALRNQTLHRLRDRHLFHWRHRRILLPLAITAAAASAWIVFAFMPIVARERNSILAAASLVYFTRVHTGRNPSRFLSKELLVGLLFTAGCFLPVLSRANAPLWPLLIPAIFFALLAWLNCHSIDRWEAEQPTQNESRSAVLKGACFSLESIGLTLKGTGFSPYIDPLELTSPLGPEGHKQSSLSPNRIFPLALLLAFAGLFLATIFGSHPRSVALLITGAAAAFLLALLDKLRSRLTPITLRAAADLILLTPVLLIPIAPLLK